MFVEFRKSFNTKKQSLITNKLRREFEKIKKAEIKNYCQDRVVSREIIDRILENLGDNSDSKVFEIYRRHREQTYFNVDDSNLYYQLALTALILDNENTFEKFFSIPKEKRLSIYQVVAIGRESDLLTVLHCFELAGNPKQSLPKLNAFRSENDLGQEQMYDFYETLPRNMYQPVWKMSSKFQHEMRRSAEYFKFDTWSRGYWTSIYILRLLYGEEHILELFDRCEWEKVKLEMTEIPDLVKEWHEIRDYPLSWSLEFSRETVEA